MQEVVDVLKSIGIDSEVTMIGRIVVPKLAHVHADHERELTPMLLEINQALQRANLLGTWRAKKGGTLTERWILVMADKPRA